MGGASGRDPGYYNESPFATGEGGYLSPEHLDEFQHEMNKLTENLQIQMKKLSYQMSSIQTQTYIEQENIKKNMYAVENQL